MATPSTLERLYSLRELQEANYGHRATLGKLIHDGILPAVKVGNAFKIRESDLPLIGQPINAPAIPEEKPEDTLGDYVKALVDNFPKLNAEQKTQLGRLLAPAA